MKLALFYHSLLSDWNHGNAHFLRGIASEFQARGHTVDTFEPADSWSLENLLRDYGEAAIEAFHDAFPHLTSRRYRLDRWPFVEEQLAGVDLIIAHEWNDPRLISALGAFRRAHPRTRLLFHDTHHRALTAEHELARFDLAEYDGVLAYGASLRDAYLQRGWGKQVHVWHEAADTRVFYPRPVADKTGDVVWIGNWGDDERAAELREFFIEPVKRLRLRTEVYGVRYPAAALAELREARIDYRGWLPNFRVPEAFAKTKATVHVPRRPYVESLPGIPTIRPFEALACGTPLISAPWPDTEGLFREGTDFLRANNGREMKAHLSTILHDVSAADSLARHGLETIRSRHTCAHRVTELLDIYQSIKPIASSQPEPAMAAGALL